MRWAGNEAFNGEMLNAINTLFRKLKGERQLGRPKHRWEGILKKLGLNMWSKFIWFRLGIIGGIL
jgi:hypothetical protein